MTHTKAATGPAKKSVQKDSRIGAHRPTGATAISGALAVRQVLSNPQATQPEAVLILQRGCGNRAVQRLLAPGRLAQRQAAGPQGGDLDPAAYAQIERVRGGGQSLDRKSAKTMGEKLGADFSDVRIHIGDQASALSDSIHAEAFTVGKDIFFNRGIYNPSSSSGQQVLAHELTHVVQQGGGLTKATVQRALPSTVDYRTLDPADVRLVAIGTAVAAYNEIAGNRTNAEGFQTCFTRLQAVDRAIFEWFAQVSMAHQRLEGNPHTPTIKELMEASEREHETLVDESKNIETVLPMATTDLDEDTLAQLRTLWQSIANNRGKIKRIGSAGFSRRALSELAKILATPTGRRMLQFLNTPKPTEVSGSPQGALNNIYIGENKDDLPADVRAASETLKQPQESIAQALGLNEKRTPKQVTEVTELDADDIPPWEADNYPEVTRDNLHHIRDAAWGDSSGFTHGGKSYGFKRDQGTGAFVSSIPGRSLHGGRGPGNEIITPGWVTLGHELGHAANMRAGATTKEFKAMQQSKMVDALPAGLAGGEEAAYRWTDAEELLTIENVENPLRTESGISEREGHQPPAWAQALAIRNRKELRDLLKTMGRDWENDSAWKDLDARARTLPMKDAVNPEKIEGMREKIESLKRKGTLLKYLQLISKTEDKAQILLQGLPTIEKRERAMSYLTRHAEDLAKIKNYLHMGFWKRREKNKSGRDVARQKIFLNLIEGKETYSSNPLKLEP